MGKQKMAAASGNGKKQSKASLLKLQHLQNVALWSSGDAAAPPSLAAFFGRRLAACREAVGMPTDESLFTCERCETLLHPGDNCTVRVEKNKARKCRKHKGSRVPTQNNVVYRCHFCSHQTVKRGTLKGHMKRICPPKVKPAPEPKVRISKPEKCANTETCTDDNSGTSKILENLFTESCMGNRDNASSALEVATEENVESESIPDAPAPVTPQVGTGRSLLDTKKRRGNSHNASSAVEVSTQENVESESVPDTPAPVTPQVGASRSLLDTKKRVRKKSGSKKEPELNSVKTDATDTVTSSKKRKRKTWTSLKDAVKSSQSSSSKNLPDIAIPFFL